MNQTAAIATGDSLPLVVHVGFAGSRFLVLPGTMAVAEEQRFLQAVQQELAGLLRRLPAELRLSPGHFLCGLSQVAMGSDMLFTRACAGLGIRQRIFLPQPRRAYLDGRDEKGDDDFAPAQRAEAERLLALPHIIEERVVSHAVDREAQFEDANLQIVGVSDVVVCLLRPDVRGRSTGTTDLMDRALQRGRPVLEVRVGVGPGGLPEWTETWHQRDAFDLPALPADLCASRPGPGARTTLADYCTCLMAEASRQALGRQQVFSLSAFVIIGAHVLATACAVAALTLHHQVITWLLVAELVLLAGGFALHQFMHHARSVQRWSLSRLVAEIVRSVQATSQVPGEPAHLFALPFPVALRPLLRTLSVLHLTENRQQPFDWQAGRGTYVADRMDVQQRYYRRDAARARQRLQLARFTFFVGSLTAFIATLAKVLLHSHVVVDPLGDEQFSATLLGTLAILMPLVAVGGLSLAASFGLEARVSTYTEMADFLARQAHRVAGARSQREFVALVYETETRLLGETATWYARRSFTGVV
jgi:hypothetical protein